MKELSPVISFLSFFFVLICILDLTLPNKGEQIHLIDSHGNKDVIVTPENAQEHFTEYNQGQLIWRESTRILDQPMRFSYIRGSHIKTSKSEYNFYIPGVVFVIFLAIGGIYGVFFKKSAYQEKQAMYYNLIVGSIVCMMYVLSLGKVV